MASVVQFIARKKATGGQDVDVAGGLSES